MKQWIAGETREDLIREATEANLKGMHALLNKLGEHDTSRRKVKQNVKDYLLIISDIEKERLDASLSVKLTQLGIDTDQKYCISNLRTIVKEAKKYDILIWIDMESSKYTEKTLHMYSTLFRTYKNLGICIQAYLRRSEQDIRHLLLQKAHIRLVKGAYKENQDIAFESKEKVNQNFIRLVKLLFQKSHSFAIATHDNEMIDQAIKLRKKQNKEIRFQFLKGVKNKLKEQLVAEGQFVEDYIPYGKEWKSYALRRLREKRGNINLILRTIWSG